jgi:DNA-binding NarL/FixJ family response regulator
MTGLLKELAAGPGPADPAVGRRTSGTLAGEVDPAGWRLLMTASGGDPALLRALALIAAGLGELTREAPTSRLAGLIADRLSVLSDAQLAALRALTQAWVRPHELVAAELERRSAVPGPIDLTRRQREVLALLGDGLTVQAIARRLCLSPRTVGKHLERMYRRLGTSDRLSTVLQAQRFGLLGDVTGAGAEAGERGNRPLARDRRRSGCAVTGRGG